MACVINVYELAIDELTPYMFSASGTITSKVPIPPGIGTIIAMVPNKSTVKPAEIPKCAVPPKHKTLRRALRNT